MSLLFKKRGGGARGNHLFFGYSATWPLVTLELHDSHMIHKVWPSHPVEIQYRDIRNISHASSPFHIIDFLFIERKEGTPRYVSFTGFKMEKVIQFLKQKEIAFQTKSLLLDAMRVFFVIGFFMLITIMSSFVTFLFRFLRSVLGLVF